MADDRIEILVDAEAVWPRVEADIREARDSVRVQSLSFALDGVGSRLVEALEHSRATDCRIVADSFYTVHKVDDRFAWHPRQLLDGDYRRSRRASLAGIRALADRGVGVRFANPCGFLFSKGFARNHKKLVVVDERVAYLGGMNFTDHNFAWHDMMLRIEDPAVARWLAADFDATWRGRNLGESSRFERLEIHRLDGRNNARRLAPLLSRMRTARHSVDLVCPYVSFPFFEPLEASAARGARVRIVMPEADNWGLFSEYAAWAAERAGIELLWYPGPMVHLKGMLIDDALLVAGSANFYFVSHDFMQEYVVCTEDPELLASFRRQVLDVDLARARPPDRVPPWRGRAAEARLRALAALGRALPR